MKYPRAITASMTSQYAEWGNRLDCFNTHTIRQRSRDNLKAYVIISYVLAAEIGAGHLGG